MGGLRWLLGGRLGAGNILQGDGFYHIQSRPDCLHLTSVHGRFWLQHLNPADAVALISQASVQRRPSSASILKPGVPGPLKGSMRPIKGSMRVRRDQYQCLVCSWEAPGWLLGGRLGAGKLLQTIAFTPFNLSPIGRYFTPIREGFLVPESDPKSVLNLFDKPEGSHNI